MSTYQIEIDDEVVEKKISDILNTMLDRSIRNTVSGAGSVIVGAVKDMVYSRKDEIIDKVVDRAVKEIVKRGLPKLLERMESDA